MHQLIKQRIKNEKGLTLIELLAVIVILGIIAAIAIPSISGIIQKSREDAVKSEAITIINAAKNYVAANGLPEDGTDTIEEEDLKEFISDTKFQGKGYSVDVNGTAYSFTSSAVKVGKYDLTFNAATIQNINNDKDTGKTRTIGKSS
ncbi:prepilin-type N-terminal cleavage/methylation domain-containing protein [Niallia alba]|uniref:type II secretion system protein n=1 Tax=Niallia alba TaxID=2729105 RepID=UPI002E21269F|nr:prepilin-type N-terminal cleavage/methylation domain-containing protein [Niallia alba]